MKITLKYNAGLMEGSAIFETMAERRSETTATGPIAISLELPITA